MKINQALNTTNSSSRRERSTEAKALEDCASLTVSGSLFVTYSSSVELDTIGTNETIKTVATSISITSITSTSCTTTEKATLTTAQNSVNTLITKVETRITQIFTMLEDITGTTITNSLILAEVEEIPTVQPVTDAATTAAATTAAAGATTAAAGATTAAAGATTEAG